jgi:hypothetical protein
MPKQTIKNTIEVITQGDNFRRAVKVEGSNNNVEFFTLVEQAYTFAVEQNRRFEQVDLPVNDYRYLRISVQPMATEENNPVTKLMVDRTKGLIKPEVLHEKVLSAIVEFMIPAEKLPRVLEVLDRVSREIDTVFSGDIISRVGADGSVPYVKAIQERGRFLSINGKSNVGLGRPLAAV